MGGVAAAAYVDRAARRGGQDTTPPRPHPAAAAKPRKHPAEGRVRVSERKREREREGLFRSLSSSARFLLFLFLFRRRLPPAADVTPVEKEKEAFFAIRTVLAVQTEFLIAREREKLSPSRFFSLFLCSCTLQRRTDSFSVVLFLLGPF